MERVPCIFVKALKMKEEKRLQGKISLNVA